MPFYSTSMAVVASDRKGASSGEGPRALKTAVVIPLVTPQPRSLQAAHLAIQSNTPQP